MRTFRDRLAEDLKDPEFKEAYQKVKQEYLLAKRIAEIRKSKGITQKQLAEMMGTSQQVISKLERGNSDNFNLVTLRKAAIAMNVELIIDLRP